MKTLIIRLLEKKLGNAELIIGTDVLKIPLDLVQSINQPTSQIKKIVGHYGAWQAKRSRMGYERKRISPSVKPHYPHDLRLRLGHGGLVDE